VRHNSRCRQRGTGRKRYVLYVEAGLTLIEEWHELLNALFQSTKSPEAAHRESAFRVFAALPTLVDISHADVLQSVFLAGLTDPTPEVTQSTIRD